MRSDVIKRPALVSIVSPVEAQYDSGINGDSEEPYVLLVYGYTVCGKSLEDAAAKLPMLIEPEFLKMLQEMVDKDIKEKL